MTIGYFVFSNLRILKMTFMSFFSQFCHSALSRPSIFIIFLLMPLIAHEYLLYVTFVALKIVLPHPNRDALKNSRNWTKFYVLARFRETIPTVKSVSSSEI